MKKMTLALFTWMTVSLSAAISSFASSPVPPVVIDHFVADLFPKASHYFWVVNATQKDTQREIIVDLKTFVTPKEGDTLVETRFLLLIRDGEVFAAQNIPVNATVDCGKEEAV